MSNQGKLTKLSGIYTASYGDVAVNGVTQKEAVLGLWNRLHLAGIEPPSDFVLYGELHEEQLSR